MSIYRLFNKCINNVSIIDCDYSPIRARIISKQSIKLRCCIDADIGGDFETALTHFFVK